VEEEKDGKSAEGTSYTVYSVPPVAPKDTQCTSAEPQCERRKRREDQPICVPELRRYTLVTNAVSFDSEQRHLEHPREERDDEGEGGRDCEEDRPGTMPGGAAESEKNGEARQACGDGDEDESFRETMECGGV